MVVAPGGDWEIAAPGGDRGGGAPAGVREGGAPGGVMGAAAGALRVGGGRGEEGEEEKEEEEGGGGGGGGGTGVWYEQCYDTLGDVPAFFLRLLRGDGKKLTQNPGSRGERGGQAPRYE